MHTIPVQIVRLVEEYQPNIVECVMSDASGRQWSFVDKLPIFTAADLDAQSSYPQPGVIACEILQEWTDKDGRKRCLIDINRPWGIAAKNGETQFEVFIDHITTQTA
ncbi:hypothetical protein [Prosthecobacter sp.]|uniref:hypothetical protein n=1 Tax=Prosthecobacter sp. TaxID=1965333 RepID=UPI002AB7FD49|nr:hypothetical protein [Prosthecobacter sp.]MDZ4405911.1 hypothetical protein [Prosthecobacter sp.]